MSQSRMHKTVHPEGQSIQSILQLYYTLMIEVYEVAVQNNFTINNT